MRYLLLTALLLATFFAGAADLGAQQIRSPFRYLEENQSLGIFGGYLLTQQGAPAVGPDNAAFFGLRYNLRFTGPLSGEAALGFTPSERQILLTGADAFDPQPTGATANVNLLFAEAGLRFHLTGPRTWRGVAPYIVGTGGVVADLARNRAPDEDVPTAQQFRLGPSFALGLGVGTDLFVAERLSLRFEGRNHIFRLQVPAGLIGTSRAENQWTNNFAISVGTAYHF